MTWVSRAAREPLLHFLLIGALVFGAFELLGEQEVAENDDTIIVSAENARQLAEAFRGSWRRAPTAKEMQALIDRYIREEVLVREALSLSLDQGDPIVRQRLTQKMEFLVSSVAQAVSPEDADLAAYLEENKDRYRSERKLAFEQVFLGPSADDETVQAVRDGLAKGADPMAIGVPTLLPDKVGLATAGQVNRSFGPGFFENLGGLALQEWAGPVPSAYGDHLVRITQSVPGALPALEDIRETVLRDWREDKAAEVMQAQIERLLDGYTVERPDPAEIAEIIQ